MTEGNSRPRGIGPPARRLTVTLYDLVAAVNDSIGPGDDKLVADVVTDILRQNRAKYHGRVPGGSGSWAESATSTPIQGDVPSDSKPKVLLLPSVRQEKA